MSGRLPDELIDRIRESNDIVDVISERIPLKRAGVNYKGRCPFHQEKTPSFNVNPERQIYHCFGCGVGGNVITFLMEYEKLGFIDAIRELAQRAGIALPERGSGRSAEDDPVFAANQMAVEFFRSSLKGASGAPAREYIKDRGLDSEVVAEFAIGYAPPGWDNLLKHARASGVKESVLIEAGLAIAREGGGQYDRFRDRLIFPLLAAAGKAVGFGGRAFGDAEPKYLNSPETRVYRKSYYLYGLNQARQSIRMTREAILVEGYMDVLSLVQAGFKNAIASAGTALTREQAKIIDRYADKVFVAYDGDDAGLSAATRAAEALVELGLKVRVALLPDGNDPDSYVRKHGADALREALASSQDFIDFFVSTNATDTADGREQAARALIETVSHVADPIKADLMLEKVAEALSLRHGAVVRLYEAKRAELKSRRPRGERRGRAQDSRSAGGPGGPGTARTGTRASTVGAGGPGGAEEPPPPTDPQGDDVEAPREVPALVRSAQEGLLALLLAGGGHAECVRAVARPDEFISDPVRGLVARIWETPGRAAADVSALIEPEDGPGVAKLLTELAMRELPEDGGRLCDDYIRTMRRAQIEEEIRVVEEEIRAAELTDDGALMARVERRLELARKLEELSGGR